MDTKGTRARALRGTMKAVGRDSLAWFPTKGGTVTTSEMRRGVMDERGGASSDQSEIVVSLHRPIEVIEGTEDRPSVMRDLILEISGTVMVAWGMA